MTTTPFTEARERLSEILDEVEQTGQEYVITRRGKNVAVILSYDEYESLIETLNVLSDDETMEALAEAEEDIAEGRVEKV